MLRSVAFAFLLGAPLLSGTAAAQRSEDEIVQQAITERRAGDTERAIETLRVALETMNSGRIHAQLGFAYQELGQWTLAFSHLRSALASDHPWVSQHQTTIEESLDLTREYVGLVDIRSSVAGAEIRIDGTMIGETPLTEPVPVRAGSAELELRAPGYVAVVRTILVHAGELSRESVDLRPESVPSNEPHLEPSSIADSELTQSPPVDAPDRRGLRASGYALGSVGAALGATSVLVYVFGDDQRAEYNSSNCVGNGLTREENCGSHRQKALRLRNASVGTLASGAALFVSGILMVVFGVRPAAESERSWTCIPGQDAGVHCALTF